MVVGSGTEVPNNSISSIARPPRNPLEGTKMRNPVAKIGASKLYNFRIAEPETLIVPRDAQSASSVDASGLAVVVT